MEMANNVAQYEDNLNAWEKKITAQFQEFLTLLQSANKLQITHAPQTKTMMKQSNKEKFTGISQYQNHKYFWTHRSCAHTRAE